jgi:integrase
VPYCLSIISKLMNWYQSRNDEYVSPVVRGMRRRKIAQTARTRKLEDDEIRAVWNASGELGTFGVLVKMLLLTAQRLRKVSNMRWDQLKNGEWHIPSAPREKGHAGVLKLPKLALDLIDAQPRVAGNPYVFVAERGDGDAFSSFSHGKSALDKKLPGMEPWVIHDLRRTARSLMSRAGVRPDISERVLGHAIVGVEGVYDRHSYQKEKADALQRLARLIETILSPPKGNVVEISRSKRRR